MPTPGAPGTPGGGAGAAACFCTSKIRFVSKLLFLILTVACCTSMETTSTKPSRSPSCRIGFLTFFGFPGSCSSISKSARFVPKSVTPVNLTVAMGGGGGGVSLIGSGGALRLKALRSTMVWYGLVPAAWSSARANGVSASATSPSRHNHLIGFIRPIISEFGAITTQKSCKYLSKYRQNRATVALKNQTPPSHGSCGHEEYSALNKTGVPEQSPAPLKRLILTARGDACPTALVGLSAGDARGALGDFPGYFCGPESADGFASFPHFGIADLGKFLGQLHLVIGLAAS